jgi:aryl-alcohol dehydrogenase-like predicted oxidoreductase
MQLIEKTKQLTTLAESLGCALSQLAIAWCLKNPYVSSVITGATKKEQLMENLGALTVKPKLTPDVMKKINAICEGS